jgi:hypothetical protein
MTTDFNFEPKILDPLCIEIGEYGTAILLANESGQQDYDLTKGVIFGGEHYGFVVITNKNGKEPSETIYPTQCPLYGMEYKDKEIRVFEFNKKIFWRLDSNGSLLQPSMFLKQWRPDVQFLDEHGYRTDEDIDKVNESGYTKKR